MQFQTTIRLHRDIIYCRGLFIRIVCFLLLRFWHYTNYSSRIVSAAYLGLHPSLVYRIYSGVVDNVDSRLVSSTALHGLRSRVVSRIPACYLTAISSRSDNTSKTMGNSIYKTRPGFMLCQYCHKITAETAYHSSKRNDNLQRPKRLCPIKHKQTRRHRRRPNFLPR